MTAPDSPSLGSLTVSGVTFEVTPAFDREDWVVLTVFPGREYWLSREEIGRLAAWLAEHGEDR